MSRLLIPLAVLLSLHLPVSTQSPAPSDDWNVQLARGKTRTIDFTTDEGTWMTVDVSPDGGTLVFDVLGEIYTLPTAGGEARLITRDSGVAVNFQPAFSPDGKRIAFISDRAGQNNLWVMDADGGNAHVVEQNLKVRHSVPAWTPDGTYIVARRAPLGDGPDHSTPEAVAVPPRRRQRSAVDERRGAERCQRTIRKPGREISLLHH